jgi:hypothetical protein
MFENKNITHEFNRQSFGQIEVEIASLNNTKSRKC